MVGTVDNPFGFVDVFYAWDVLTPGVTTGTVAIQNQSRYHSDGFVSTSPTGWRRTSDCASYESNWPHLIRITDLVRSRNPKRKHRYTGGWICRTPHLLESHGEIESWNPIDNSGYRGVGGSPATQTQVQSLTAPVGAWPTGTSAYILWLDDSVTNPECTRRRRAGLRFEKTASLTGTPLSEERCSRRPLQS
jgi:hypothetical protein